MERLAKIIFIGSLFTGCAGLGDLAQNNPGVTGGIVGAVGGKVVQEAIENLPKFKATLRINPKEICIVEKNDVHFSVKCAITPCDNRTKCSKEYGDAFLFLEEYWDKLVLLTKEAVVVDVANINAFCDENKEACEYIKRNYTTIDKDVLIDNRR